MILRVWFYKKSLTTFECSLSTVHSRPGTTANQVAVCHKDYYEVVKRLKGYHLMQDLPYKSLAIGR